jgi:hypothetical protein
LSKELIVSALFDDTAVLHNANAVGVADGAEVVGDDNRKSGENSDGNRAILGKGLTMQLDTFNLVQGYGR